MCPRFLRNVCLIKRLIILIDFYQSTSVVSTKDKTQYCLLNMLEKWKSTVDKGKSSGSLLIDLCKAFDCLSHNLFFAKLHSYGFSFSPLKLIHSYLTNRKQRTKIYSLGNKSFLAYHKDLS